MIVVSGQLLRRTSLWLGPGIVMPLMLRIGLHRVLFLGPVFRLRVLRQPVGEGLFARCRWRLGAAGRALRRLRLVPAIAEDGVVIGIGAMRFGTGTLAAENAAEWIILADDAGEFCQRIALAALATTVAAALIVCA